MKPVKLSELIDVLELDSPDYVTLVDRQEGCVVTVEQTVLSAIEEGDEESLGHIPAWQKGEIAIARAIVEDSGQRFVSAPDKSEFHEYRQMERFIGTVADAHAADQLWRAIKGKGAFRYFKDTASRLGLLEQWYRFREDAMKEFVIDWAEAANVAWSDDQRKNPHP